ncbi:MAG: hypothetical protein A2X82_06965 [Geobacteraceae bacterium GWC2_55_20]|nr:MAG: hypothetical protein A2X82_06965 [Geobacteraceae bacterium GWC2_55_20]HCE68371.1 hypothetical protein [Geobacter sp.]
MSIAPLWATAVVERSIKRFGRPFRNSRTNSTVQGFSKDSEWLYQLSDNLAPGDVLHDTLDKNRTHVVAELKLSKYNCHAATLIEHRLRATIKRKSTVKDSFGRTTAEPITVAADVPIRITDQKTATVPLGVDINRGDMVDINCGETYLVAAMGPHEGDGLLHLIVQLQDAGLIQALM